MRSITDQLRALPTRAIRTDAVDRLARRLFQADLRAPTFHEVPDADAFARILDELTQRYEIVDLDAVIAAARDGAPLPANAVWLTFDDGHHTVFEHAAPVLRRFGVPATLFVCPGLIESGRRFWWDVVGGADLAQVNEAAHCDHQNHDEAIAWLKSVSDAERRLVVELLDTTNGTRHQPPAEALRQWTTDGHTVGNHTWDHPCLDMATPDEQRQQLRRAHQWLTEHVDGWRPVFAYPNGNWSPIVEAELEQLGYELAVLHDHALTDSSHHRFRLSRLHAEADDPPERLRAVVNGTQPCLKRAGARLRALSTR